MDTYYIVVSRTEEAWDRTNFRFSQVTEAAQFCSNAGNSFFVVAVENGRERVLTAEEQGLISLSRIHGSESSG